MLFKQFFKRNVAGLTAVIILGVLSSIASILSPLSVKWFIDSVLVDGQTSIFYFVFALIFVSLVFGELLKTTFKYVYSKLSFKLVIYLKNNVFRIITDMPYVNFRKQNNKNMNIFLNDIKSIQDTGIDTMPDLLISLFIGVGAAIYLLYIDAIFLIGTLIISFISLLPLLVINKRQGKFVTEAHIAEQNLTSFVEDTINKPLLLKVINNNGTFLSKLQERALLLQKKSLKRELNFRTYLLIRVFFDSLIPAFVFLVGGYLYFSGEISIGNIVASLLLVPSITKPVNNFTGYYLTLKDIVPRIKRINEILHLSSESKTEIEKQIPLNVKTVISFENVQFHIDDQTILRDVSFKLEEGQHTRILGESGSGKSTIINLLLGLYKPSGGQITVNNEIYNSVEINKLLSVAPQEPYFLNDTILNNLLSVNPSASDTDIENSLVLSCSDEFIAELPDGLHTKIGENGSKLSGGQLQRLGIARAILANRKFLLLDESTSALNIDLEQKVLRNLFRLKNVTIVHINHRMYENDYEGNSIFVEDQTVLN